MGAAMMLSQKRLDNAMLLRYNQNMEKPRKLDEKEFKSYRDDMGQRCPNCGSTDIDYSDDAQSDCIYSWRDSLCGACGATWTEEFDLVAVVGLIVPEKT